MTGEDSYGFPTPINSSLPRWRHQMEHFRLTGSLRGKFTDHRWIPHTNASDAELWCILWSAPQPAVEQKWRRLWFETPSRSSWRHCYACLVHPGVRDKRRVSEIDLSQPRHETAFWWRNNGPVTSQLTDPIKWPNYPLHLIGIFVHTSTYKKESLQQRCRRSTNTTVFDIFVHISIWFES